MATPKKLASGKWNVVVFSHIDENGKRKYVSFTASTKAEASRMAAEFQTNKKYENTPNVFIGEAIEKYIASKTNVLSPSTLVGYERMKKYYKPIWFVRIASLNSLALQNFVNDISAKVSPKTCRNIFALLMSAISLYSDRNYKVKLPQKIAIERNIPCDEEVKMLIENANPRLRLAIILGSQGLRRGEICGLKYRDLLVDFSAIYIHSDMIKGENGWILKECPKTDSSNRRVILPKQIIQMMVDCKGDKTDNDFIVDLLPDTVTTKFVALRNRLGLKCRFHDLRHYAASILHSIGVPDTYIQERCGWGSDNVLKSVYRNSLADKSRQFTELANDYFDKTIMPEKSKKADDEHVFLENAK
jgi:integrase